MSLGTYKVGIYADGANSATIKRSKLAGSRIAVAVDENRTDQGDSDYISVTPIYDGALEN